MSRGIQGLFKILCTMHQGREVPLPRHRQWMEVEARVSSAIKSGFCEPRERNTPLDVLLDKTENCSGDSGQIEASTANSHFPVYIALTLR